MAHSQWPGRTLGLCRIAQAIFRHPDMVVSMSSSSLFGSLITAGLILAGADWGIARPRAACDVLSLAEIRSLVGAQVAVFAAGSSAPITRGDSTVSSCTYVMTDAAGRPANGLSAKFTLMWAPKDKLTQSNDFYAKRHIEATGMKDDILVVAWIGSPADGTAGDWSASQKLLAAVLAKL